MIRYDLICDKGHEFDGWFSNSEAFETQAKRGFVECTHCGSNRVEKQLRGWARGPPRKARAMVAARARWRAAQTPACSR